MSTQTVVVVNQKSMFMGLLLTFFFGPLGMLYSTVIGAVIMFFVNVMAFVFTAGIGLIITWPIGLIWSGIAISNHNSNLVAGGTQRVHEQSVQERKTLKQSVASNTQQASQPNERKTEEFQPATPPKNGNRAASCDSCGGVLEEDDNFCMNCGTERKKQVFCSGCGAVKVPNSKFCSSCGQKA